MRLVVLLSAACCVLAPGAAEAAKPGPGPFLSITGHAGRAAPKSAPSRAALALLLNSLSEERRAEWANALADLSARIKRRRNPFFVDLDQPSTQEIDRMLAAMAPSLTAASALAAGAWRSADGDLEVRLVERCTSSDRCTPVFGTDARQEGRARFLAWPLAYAVMVRTSSPTESERLALHARLHVSDPVALVLTAADTRRLRESPSLQALQKHSRYLAANLPRGRLAALMADLARLDHGACPSLHLPDDAVLVVPRLGALAQHEHFVEVAHQLLRSATPFVGG